MAEEPRLPPDEAEGDQDEIPHEQIDHQPRGGQLDQAAAGKTANMLELRVEDEDRVATHRLK